MVTVPEETPVTLPVASTVAMASSEDVQGVEVAAVPEPVSAVEDPAQTVRVPVITAASFTVRFCEVLQPSWVEKVMVAVPAATAVTLPVLSTVTTAVLEDVNGLTVAGVPVNISVALVPAQIGAMAVNTGVVLTVTVTVALQPLALV